MRDAEERKSEAYTNCDDDLNDEASCTHIGMAFSAQAFRAIGKRLAQA